MADNEDKWPYGDAPDASNSTREFPTQAAQHPTTQRPATQWSTPNHPSAPGYPFPVSPAPSAPQPERARRTVGLVGASVAGASLLVIGLAGGYLIGGSGDNSTQRLASVTTTGQAQIGGQAPATTDPAPTAAQSPAVGAPSTTDAGVSSTTIALGAAVGTVSAINGANFTVQGLDGVSCRVTTTNSTRVATLRGSGGVRNLSVGDPVLVKGVSGPDGVMTAELVIAGAFPDLGSGTS
ncbi:DUF5666 domain-containing protein [Tomitella biformata]|uniref:DUF5666 domain-containing protein n=1 Tax=Tomitella biformata TaxID=630403 RepID=UPI000466E4FF|nr:DUF5666 domain-containing protein [Tomitella biformata]